MEDRFLIQIKDMSKTKIGILLKKDTNEEQVYFLENINDKTSIRVFRTDEIFNSEKIRKHLINNLENALKLLKDEFRI